MKRTALATADSIVDLFAVSFGLLVVSVGFAAGVALSLAAGLGLFFLAATVAFANWFDGVERRRVAAVYGLDLPQPARRRTSYGGWRRPLHQAWLDVQRRSFWRVMVHHLATLCLGIGSLVVLYFLVGGAVGLFLAPVVPAEVRAQPTTHWMIWVPRLAPAVSLALGVVYLLLATAWFVVLPRLHRAASLRFLGVPEQERLAHELELTSSARDGAVRAADSDRRRIERDLHDGVQPQLVNVGMMLSLARTKLDHDPEGARRLLDEAHAGTKTAIHDLRQLARGIHPAILSDQGLDAALTALIARSVIPTSLDVHAPARYGSALESVVYFAVAEGLANVAKHSDASHCRVRVAEEDAGPGQARLVVEISDDGRGGATVVPHGGLAGIMDRVRAVGGSLSVDSQDSGTTVVAVIPCAS